MSENIWNCECGQTANSGKFCINCGKRKPEQAAVFAAEVKPVEAEVIGRTEQPLVRNVPAAAPYIPAAQPAQPVYQTVPANRSYYNTVPVNSAPPQTSSASLILGIFSLVCLFIQPLGVILAIIGLINSRKGGVAGKILNVLGLILGGIFLLLDLFFAFLIMVSK